MQQQNDQQKKLDLQKVAQAKNMRKGEMFGEKLNTEKFPDGKLSEDWRECVFLAIMKTAPYHHKLSLKEFSEVVENADNYQFTLFQFGVLSNSLEMVSPDTLALNNKSYAELIKEATDHITWYQNRIKELQKEIELEVESEFKAKDLIAGKSNLKVAEA